MTRLEILELAARARGLTVRTWAPGDGAVRYRFFRIRNFASVNPWTGEVTLDSTLNTPGAGPGQTYFGPENGIETTLGLNQAYRFLSAYGMGLSGMGRNS
jgi:hypothetical protein